MMIATYGASDKDADFPGYYHPLLSSNLPLYTRYPIVKTYTFPDQISTFTFAGLAILMHGKPVRIFDT